MTDLIRRLAEIREQAGYDPLPDPRVIDGPPANPQTFREDPVQTSDETDEADFPDEIVEPMLAPSPLQRLGSEPARPPQPPGGFPEPFMAVVEASGSTVASYQGREVSLTEIETAAVRRVVLKALQRQVKAQLAEVEALMPKRRRRARKDPNKPVRVMAQGPTGPPTEITMTQGALDAVIHKRRRGRPRKVAG